jgi:hypothetical protein
VADDLLRQHQAAGDGRVAQAGCDEIEDFSFRRSGPIKPAAVGNTEMRQIATGIYYHLSRQ